MDVKMEDGLPCARAVIDDSSISGVSVTLLIDDASADA